MSTLAREAMLIFEVLAPLWDKVKSWYLQQLSQVDRQETRHIALKVLCMADETERVYEHPNWQQSSCE